MDVTKELREREQLIRPFAAICKKYLEGKQMYYDDKNYRIDVKWPDERTIDLSDLSLKEKQIVSFFSHISFTPAKRVLVIIDEPELSLSVPWQKNFRPDIFASDKCDSLLAVTHSPFIFDNSLHFNSADVRTFMRALAG